MIFVHKTVSKTAQNTEQLNVPQDPPGYLKSTGGHDSL